MKPMDFSHIVAPGRHAVSLISSAQRRPNSRKEFEERGPVSLLKVEIYSLGNPPPPPPPWNHAHGQPDSESRDPSWSVR
jgi:hypothetical protein